MLWTIIIILLVLWLLGLLGHIGGSLIHLLLVIAVIVLILILSEAGNRSESEIAKTLISADHSRRLNAEPGASFHYVQVSN